MNLSRLRVTSVDGRWLVIGCLCAYFATLFIAHARGDYRAAWIDLGVPAVAPLFLDLHGVVAAAESERAGYDPLVRNPYDPYQRVANYPRVWYKVFKVLNLDQNCCVVVGVGLALIFYTCALLFAGPMTWFEGVAWSFFLCAPPAMMAVERGNNDLGIFILLAVALHLRRNFNSCSMMASYALVGACACLKLFPFVAFCMALRERLRPAWTVLIVSVMGFAAYLYVIREQVKAIRTVLPQPFIDAFGQAVFADHCNVSHPGMIPPFLSIVVMLLLLVLAGSVRYLAPRMPAMPGLKVEGLMVGSIVYVSTFALNNNSNYRLVFLLFAVPALLCLCKEPGFYGKLCTGLLVALMIGWIFSGWRATGSFLAKEICNWLVFAGMAFLWLECFEPDRLFRGSDAGGGHMQRSPL